ncbi:MAG: hypothetical protein ABI378_06950 [Chitinophagaceae bacterium]
MSNDFLRNNVSAICGIIIFCCLTIFGAKAQTCPKHNPNIFYYSYLSKCNVVFQQSDKMHARITIDKKTWDCDIRINHLGKDWLSLYSKGKLICTYFFDEESLFILNNQYQYRCEDAKLIQLSVLHDTTINDDFINYFRNRDYIIKDTISIVAKAAVMNRNQDYSFSLALLNQLILKYPNNGIAYLYLSDALNGLKRKSEAAKAYSSYKKILLGSGRKTEYRPY